MIERAYYSNDIPRFVSSSQEQILGELAKRHNFTLDIEQRNAWIEQVSHLQEHLRGFRGGEIFLEFSIPRMGKRVDVVILIRGVVFVIEYKVGAKSHDRYAIDQVTDYALDLKNFHEGSRDKHVVPILVSTKAEKRLACVEWANDGVAGAALSNGSDLIAIMEQALSEIPPQDEFRAVDWLSTGYRPTPTIVEAAQALYRNHSVAEISRSDSGTTNLTRTSGCISEIIEYSKAHNRKSICFVTGVPGAGKTLAGLNISSQWSQAAKEECAVFLSGNGPLLAVLREALARDEVARATHRSLSKKKAASKVSSFIQNVHSFRDETFNSKLPPPEHVVIFDEAQRAWDRASAEKFMRQKRAVPQFGMSEPEFLLSVMDRGPDWRTIICLVGGGQEINTGEAGLVEWFDALNQRFRNWDVYHSDQITHKAYSWGQDLPAKLAALGTHENKALHLAVSIRSYRAEKVSDFVGAVIDGERVSARSLLAAIQKDYPIVLTRDLAQAREWLRKRARGSERYGLVASSGALRLKAEGINVKAGIDPVKWFLNDRADIRSSYYLEDAATEFDIQGLELDWTCVCWDADFRRQRDEWGLYAFRGASWQLVRHPFRQAYLANAYRVLLTRARQGMTLFVPRGNADDHTRPPKFYDDTYDFLSSCGIQNI